MIRDILRNFRCPILDDGNCRHNNRPEDCNNGEESNKRLPTFVCVYNLMKKCNNVVFGDEPRCIEGFHIKASYLSNLDKFEHDNQRSITGFFYRYCVQECAVCKEKICDKRFHKQRRWALLENCSHFTCLPCMGKYRKISHNCSMCRVHSDRYIWSNWHQIHDENRKKYLFKKGDRQIIEDRPMCVRGHEPIDKDNVIVYRVESNGNIVYLDPPPFSLMNDRKYWGLIVTNRCSSCIEISLPFGFNFFLIDYLFFFFC